ncbi:serine/threonine protein kinase [Telmatocola sphagniphila]|uniref:Serine/threonine protein kinase n=1 Tax=Telmatocola sphagniphila TaxID=1123043 RepID=A0A8E6B755_9BACT|nr:serine/threonine-protein kinase [Telmatocola sphagniphila]QVL32597.1 serine/threonine protein kinase [Telmatocola sphagniphila]
MKLLENWAVVANADPQEIAKEIVQRKWLTPYQVKEFWKGKGDKLILKQYIIVDKIGEGGMGDVYKARHSTMDREVAIKLIRQKRLSNPDAIKRFQKEIQAAAQLQHENVVIAYDADQQGDSHFFVMEYVEGINLFELVKKSGALPVASACEYILQAAMGLQHAYERGMVHRDIKPANLLLNKTGTVKILDMGLARIDTATSADETRLTTEGITFGTPDFISPEQCRNPRDVDIRSDIYALAASLYYLLTGSPMYPTGTPAQKMIAHNTEPIPTVDRIDMPAGLPEIITKALAKDPALRYQTPVEFAEALKPYAPRTNTVLTGLMAKLGTEEVADTIPEVAPYEPDTASRFRFASLNTERPVRGNKSESHSNKKMMLVISTVCVLALILLLILLVLTNDPGAKKNLKTREIWKSNLG